MHAADRTRLLAPFQHSMLICPPALNPIQSRMFAYGAYAADVVILAVLATPQTDILFLL